MASGQAPGGSTPAGARAGEPHAGAFSVPGGMRTAAGSLGTGGPGEVIIIAGGAARKARQRPRRSLPLRPSPDSAEDLADLTGTRDDNTQPPLHPGRDVSNVSAHGDSP